MKLFELRGVKKYHTLMKHELLEMLEDSGVKWLSSGRYGEVFAPDGKDYVIKVFDNDPYYMSFINFAARNPNPHYPKVIRKPLKMHAFHTRFKGTANNFYVVKIEKLYPITDINLLKFIVENLEDTASQWDSHKRGHFKIEPNPYHTKLMPDGTSEKGATNLDLVERFPWFKSLCEAYVEMIEQVDGSPDIHGDNFMQRKDGTIVIIDPVWEGTSPVKDYYDALSRETDYGDDYEEEPPIRGPRYKWMDDREKAELEKERAAQKAARALKISFDDLDDIPF